MMGLWVFLGGGLGSLLRYGVSRLILSFAFQSSFPLATLISNVLASFALGILAYYFSGKIPEASRLFWMVGFCGGFSTFSTFSLENLELLKQGQFLFLGINIALSLSLCLGIIAFLHYHISE